MTWGSRLWAQPKRFYIFLVTCTAAGVGLSCYLVGGIRLSDAAKGARGLPSQVSATASTDSTSEGGVTLPDSERQYLGQIEHFVVVLDFRFWPALSEALRDQNRDQVASFFTPGAQAALVNEQGETRDSLGFAEFRTLTATTAGDRPGTITDLVEHWLAAVGRFQSGRQVSIKTVFLSPQERVDLAGPWRGLMLVRIWGQSLDAGPAEHVIEADFEMTTPQDEVPNPPSWLTSCKIKQESLRQTPHALMAEMGKTWGIDRSALHDNWAVQNATARVVTGGVYLTDYDLDGRIDVLVTDLRRNVLYHQVAPGRFEDVTLAMGLGGLASAVPAAFADLDNDGYPDLIAGNQLYRNEAGQRFRPAGMFPVDDSQVSGVAVADYDRDGRLDVYFTRGAPSPQQSKGKASWLDDRTGPGNSLLRNLGQWKFEDVTSRSGTSGGNPSCFAAAWLDVNGDMWPDLFVGDEFGSPVLLVNNKDGTFESRSINTEFGGFCMGVAAGDLDDDGRPDLYMANMYSKAGERVLSNLNFQLYPPQLARRMRHIVDGSELWHNCGDLRFESKGRASGVARVGWAYGPCLADLDNDGRLDIYAPAGFYSVSRTEPDG